MSESVFKPGGRDRNLAGPAALAIAIILYSTGARAQDLGQILKGLLEPSPRKMDLIDRHAAAASRELSRSLEQCDGLAKSGQWNAAVEQLQYIVDLPEDALIQKRGVWISIKRAAERRIIALPEEGRRAYLNQYSAAAAEALARARTADDFESLVRVASRFRMTPSGQSAANEIISLLFDAGDPVAAAQWLSELEQDHSPLADSPEWKARKTAIWQALGKEDSSRDSSSIPARAPTDVETFQPASRGCNIIDRDQSGARSSAADQPLLLEEWSSKGTQVPGLQEEVEQRQTDLFAAEHHPIPVANAVASNGLLAFRTAAGLEARNALTGSLLWRARGRSSLEAQSGASSYLSGGAMILGPGDNQESHPLVSYFYRDAVIGQLSTDGRRIFAISRNATLPTNGFELLSSDRRPDEEDRSFNSIVALGFATGRRLWSIGGSKDDAPFAAPLSGVYFFGPPTIDGEELFVIGAAGPDITLYCLEASTGLPKWQQFIAQYDSTKIEDDFVRQMWSCTPTVTRGVIYCPTNSGWLVAVDRHRRRLAWATRYTTGEVSDRYQPQYTLSGVNERWAPNAPILTQGTVVFAPPELPDEPMQTEPQLFRIDAVTGKVVFKRSKVESIAVAGVYGENILVLGSEGLESWPPLAKWGSRWTTPYPKGLTPCGLGLAINGVYWLPCLEGAVVGFRLTDGAIEKVLKNEALAGRLGNLTAYRDRIFSAGPTGIVGLWQRGPFDEQLADRLARDPRDLESHLRKARGLFSEHRIDGALRELESADFAQAAATELAKQSRELEWACLVEWLSHSNHVDAARWSAAKTLADSPDRLRILEQLDIDRLIAAKDWEPAIEHCWKALDESSGAVNVGPLQVRRDLWLAGRLQDVWTQVPESLRKELDRRITSRLAIDDSRLEEQGPPLQELFSFHAEGQKLALRLAAVDRKKGNLALAESRLLPLVRAFDTELARDAAVALAQTYQQHHCAVDSAEAVDRLKSLPENARLSDGTSIAEWLAARTPDEPAPPGQSSRWALSRGRVIRLGSESEFEAAQPVRIGGRPAHWMAGKRFEFARSWDGLAMVDRRTGRPDWTMPLASSGVLDDGSVPAATAHGSLLALCSRGMIHVCSPRDQKLLWTWPLPPRFAAAGAYAWAEEYLSNPAAQTSAQAVNDFQLNIGNLRLGPIMTIAGERLVLLGQHELMVFDVRTGEEQWRRSGIAASSVLVADDKRVCVSATAAGGPAAYRLLDGKQLESRSMQPVFARAFAVDGDGLLTRQRLPGFLGSSVLLMAERPFHGETVWSHAVSAEAVIQKLPCGQLGVVEPGGDVFIIDLQTGRRTDVGRLSQEQMTGRRAIHLLSDADRIYVIIQRQQRYEFSNISIPGIMINGEVAAFDRRQGRMIWKERVRDASLLTAGLTDSPVVLLVEYGVPERRRKALDLLHLPELKLRALDKSTGAHVIDWSGTTPHGAPGTLIIDPARQRIDVLITTYNQNSSERLRLQFGASTPTSVP